MPKRDVDNINKFAHAYLHMHMHAHVSVRTHVYVYVCAYSCYATLNQSPGPMCAYSGRNVHNGKLKHTYTQLGGAGPSREGPRGPRPVLDPVVRL